MTSPTGAVLAMHMCAHLLQQVCIGRNAHLCRKEFPCKRGRLLKLYSSAWIRRDPTDFNMHYGVLFDICISFKSLYSVWLKSNVERLERQNISYRPCRTQRGRSGLSSKGFRVVEKRENGEHAVCKLPLSLLSCLSP